GVTKSLYLGLQLAVSKSARKLFVADPSLIGEEAHDADLYSSIFAKEKKGRSISRWSRFGAPCSS
uniref:Uncharacterized protein n=1 Tax=Triticum urartu TaxID=4572 RepID=A0A8R7TDH8_TRIUA